MSTIPPLHVCPYARIDVKSLRAQNEELEDEVTRVRKEKAVTPVRICMYVCVYI